MKSLKKYYSFALLCCLLFVSCARKIQVTSKPSLEIALSIESITVSDLLLNASKYEGQDITLTGHYRSFSKELLRDNFSQKKGRYNFLIEQEARMIWIRSEKKNVAIDGEIITVVFRILQDAKGRYYFEEI